MWSFEGEHRRRPNVSLSGASKLMDKSSFLERLKKEREARENNKRRGVAAVRLQSFIRGSLCRIRTNQQYRTAYDVMAVAAVTPITEPAARALCLMMLRMYRTKKDEQRLVSLCSLLVRQKLLLQWVVEDRQVWPRALSQIMHLALEAITKLYPAAPGRGDTSRPATAAPAHAGPLRLLEVLLQPQGWAALPCTVSAQQQAECVFLFLGPLIMKGYFGQLITILVMKVPDVDSRTVTMAHPLARSVVNFILFPLYLVATCRRPSEHFNDTLSDINMPWITEAVIKQQIFDNQTQIFNSDQQKSPRGHSTTVTTGSLRSGARGSGRQNTDNAAVHDDEQKEIGSQIQHGDVKTNTADDNESMDEGSGSSTENVSFSKSESCIDRTTCQSTSKPVKCPREDDDERQDREKVLRISDPDNDRGSSSSVESLPQNPEITESSDAKSDDFKHNICPAVPCPGDAACVVEATQPQSSGSEAGDKLVCYAFGGVPANVPANFINLTLYNLVEELLTSSRHSLVHHYVVPCVEESRLLLRHPAATHALIQAVHLALEPSDQLNSPGYGAFDEHAATKLSALLLLVPINTRLSTTSLQLYLQSCRRLVRRTAQFVPQAQERKPGDSDDEDEDDDEEDYDDDMDADEINTVNTSEYNRNMNQPQMSSLWEEWCLDHINSPEYVSWLLDEVENSHMDRDVLTEFCGLTHTLLTTPSLSLFQCRLMYGVVGRQPMQRAMWGLLTSLYPCWLGPSAGQDRRGRGSCRLVDTVSRGAPLEATDRDTLVPVLASFATALLAVLATLHDSELVTALPGSIEGLLSTSATGATSGGSTFAFSVPELVTISGTLRDVCIGLAELAHPDTRASTLTDVSYKSMWDHCFKCCVDVVRQLHLRDTRRMFCPDKHWLTTRISLPDLPHTASYKSLLRRGRRRTRAFMPTQWRTRAQLLAEDGSGGPGSQLSMYEKVRATVLQELPFVFPFTDRAEVFMRLVQEDRSIAQENSAFNVGPSINIRVRRTHIYEDSLEKLSQRNEPNMRLSLRVQLLNAAGAIEAGVDGGGLFREFLSELLKSSFDPNRGFFLMTRENTLYPNPSAHLLHKDFQSHYYFIGRMLGKALYEKLLVEIPLAGFFLSKLLSRKGFSIEFHHLDSLDPELCRNLLYLKTHKGDVQELGLDFTVLISELGHNTVVELIPDGANIAVTSANKIEYIYRMADFKLNKQIAKQCYAFRKGLHDVVPAEWLQLFDWRELQTMISGSATPVNIADLRENAKYNGDYNARHRTIKLFWQVVEQFNEQQRRQLLKFVTSCSRPPLLGFKDLYPPFCIQPSGSDQRLPSAATCVNILKLPEYSDPITLREKLLYSITSNAGFELS